MAFLSNSTPSSVEIAHFRTLLHPEGHPKLEKLSSSTAREWYEDKKDLPALQDFLRRLEFKHISRPYHGFTSDGTVIDGLFQYTNDEGAPIEKMTESALNLISLLSSDQRESTIFSSVHAEEIRIWSNPEFYVNPGGLRLDECSENIQKAVHAVLVSSLSQLGYEKVRGCCLVNGFLGEIVNGKKVLNEHSYNFRLFGYPSLVRPWGFTFFGHHLSLVVVVAGSRMVIGPTFMGAEPDHIDEGLHAGLRLFTTEREVSLRLMQSLSPALKEKTILARSVLPEHLPQTRWAAHDERHLGGAGQDNRVVPYEGCPVSLFNSKQKEDIVILFRAFNEYYPEPVLDHRVRSFVKAYLDSTYFAWIGGCNNDDVYYFRIHSPIAFIEFDFHSGVFLTNREPDKCHIHTVNRIPNRGDYGKALISQYEQESKQTSSNSE